MLVAPTTGLLLTPLSQTPNPSPDLLLPIFNFLFFSRAPGTTPLSPLSKVTFATRQAASITTMVLPSPLRLFYLCIPICRPADRRRISPLCLSILESRVSPL
ncbi:uncharacterized protein DS421_5g150720 [Arachis hypogaea]|nr:uncharacterized protein DS421_5g150720 [Arachis hypogaea]